MTAFILLISPLKDRIVGFVLFYHYLLAAVQLSQFIGMVNSQYWVTKSPYSLWWDSFLYPFLIISDGNADSCE